jgi:NAD-dependent SIR2 family protein deacetylase
MVSDGELSYCPACGYVTFHSNTVCFGSGHHKRGGRCIRNSIDSIKSTDHVRYKKYGTIGVVEGAAACVAAANRDRLKELGRESEALRLTLIASTERLSMFNRALLGLAAAIDRDVKRAEAEQGSGPGASGGHPGFPRVAEAADRQKGGGRQGEERAAQS